MSFLDNKIRELYSYLPPLTKRPDFDEFWRDTIAHTKAVPLKAEVIPYDYPSQYVKVYEIQYNGFDDTRIHGWYMVPAFIRKEKYPCLINYHGFTGNRGMPAEFMAWIMMGMAVISVDCREQSGKTGNSAVYTAGMTANVACKGVLDKNEYYYRAVYMDCIKVLDFANSRPEVDADRLVIHGASQGGALGMAVCSLDSRPWLAMVDVPSCSNIEARIEGEHGSFASITEYLKKHPYHLEKVYETLSYFDTMNMADKIRCRILASVALKDNVCPAKCYFASYNRITAPKDIKIYPFNGHEGGHEVHMEEKLRYLKENGVE
jgi:cephalosporin-C deacetylase